jgi:signal transduction histidine kinase/ActR/RegA family two-component response regulator
MLGTEAELRIVILAPTRRDGRLTSELLQDAAIISTVCTNAEQLVELIEAGAGALLLTDDVTRDRQGWHGLHRVLDHQPEWSELPIIALAKTDSGESQAAEFLQLPGVVLLERPVRARTLLSAVHAALRSRQRQYLMRAHLEQIRTTNSMLEEASRTKDEFLATLAHELRNPLGALANAANVIARGAKAPGGSALASETISRQIAHMSRLLDDLMDIARITRHRMVLRKTRVDLGSILAAAVETTRPSIEARRQQLSVTQPSEGMTLFADPVRMAQVISNLLVNASKYTESGGQISLCASAEGAGLLIRVRDTGIGIPRDALGRIFAMFSQLRPALERSEGGLGIGLALAKGLTELHGGTISAHSEGPGLGSEFVIRLPVESWTVGPEVSAGERVALLEPCRVLLADDNPDALETLACLLEMDGHTVFRAKDGFEALAIAQQELLDAVVLDIGMPGMNGYEAARRVRRSSRGGDLTLIALTGWGQSTDKTQASLAGFDHHLTKPVNIEELQSLLARKIETRQQA